MIRGAGRYSTLITPTAGSLFHAEFHPRWFLEPCMEGVPRVRGERRASFLSPFADASHMGAGAEMDGIPVEADQLGEA